MKLGRTALSVVIFMAVFVLSNSVNAALTYEYNLGVVNINTGAWITNTYTSVPATMNSTGSEASATLASLNAYTQAVEIQPLGIITGGGAKAELIIRTDAPTRLDISFEYNLDASGSSGYASVSTGGTAASGSPIYGPVSFRDSMYYNSGTKTGSHSARFFLFAGESFWMAAYAIEGYSNLGNYQLGSLYNISITETPVPLPASVFLFASGLVGLVGIRRGKRKSKK